MQFSQAKGLSNTKICGKLRCIRFGYLLGASFLQYGGYSTRRKEKRRDPRNHYDVLYLTPRATQTQIKSSYYELSKTFHPDVNKSSEASRRFSEISEAYEVLGNIQKRRLYDKKMLNPSGSRNDRAHYSAHSHFHDVHDFPQRPSTPFRGRTKAYNFDEFYRQHYQEHRQQTEDNEENQKRQALENENQKADMMRAIFAIGVMMGITLTLWPFAPSGKGKGS